MIWIHADEQTDVPGPCAVTIGKFDGLHLGHRLLLSAIRDKAQKEGMKTAVIAVSPSNTAADRENLQLLTDRERAALLTEWGIDWLADLDFTEETRRMSAERFVRDVLVSRFHAAYLAVGEDFCFGYERRGTPAFLAQLSASCGYTVETFPKVSWNGEEISSTRLRCAFVRQSTQPSSDSGKKAYKNIRRENTMYVLFSAEFNNKTVKSIVL